MMNFLRRIPLLLTVVLLNACTVTPTADCGPGKAACAPADAIDDPLISKIHDRRTYRTAKELEIDPVQFGVEFEIPVQGAVGRIVGPTPEDARNSLAAKIWLIENAQHTVDVMYYIYNHDLTGYAIMAALCDAVGRGVDVRLMVDSLGSMSANKTALAALEVCEDSAGFMRNADGQVTNRRARIQVVIFNALSRLSTSPNRRSHDKLLVVDGQFAGKAWMMTGGRNISLNYYGITAAGEIEPHTYRDSEILLHPNPSEGDEYTLGEVSAGYYSLLFVFRGNKLLTALSTDQAQDLYYKELGKSFEALEQLKALPIMQPHFESMPEYFAQGLEPANALLAHNMANLDNKRVVRNVGENWERNPNSILYVLNKIQESKDGAELTRIVSPYLFLARYEDKDGNLLLDEAERTLQWLDENPDAEVEIITNSVLTSDNFSAQSVIDLDTAPRLLLDADLREAWLNLSLEEEVTSDLTTSAAWVEQVNHPRLRIYETGKLDADVLVDGGVPYGKLHAKFWSEDEVGFVGTDNFDYRSRLYNNEMGYFFQSDGLSDQLDQAFEELRSLSYRWGSPEWLEMRRQVAAKGGMKGSTTKRQRTVYKTLKATGLIWLF